MGKVSDSRRRVRQGDPLSPLLFVPAANFLQTLLNLAKAQGLLTLPVDLPHNQDFPILCFADDTLIFMQGDTRKLFFLPKEILFAEAHGYNTRFSNGNKKTAQWPIRHSCLGHLRSRPRQYLRCNCACYVDRDKQWLIGCVSGSNSPYFSAHEIEPSNQSTRSRSGHQQHR